jgi:hypothetical protein
MHFYDWTISICGVLAGLAIMYHSGVSSQRCSFVQMHEREEVTPSTSPRKRRYNTSCRYSPMKELKRARESKKRSIGITAETDSIKKTLTFPKKHQEMDSNASSVTSDGISEVEEEKDGEDKPVNIIMVSNMSNLTSLSFWKAWVRSWKVKGHHFY